MTGTVYKSTGSWYVVKTSEDIFFECRIKGKFRIKGIKSTNPVAVGDVVDFELETQNNTQTGIITKIHPRKNYLIRKSVNLSKQVHILAANIDQVFLLITLQSPVTTTTFIDRFLASTEAYTIKTILLFNKIDTYDEDMLMEQKYLQHIYTQIGYECYAISAQNPENVAFLKEIMCQKVSIFAGHSGVGKSTLVNALEPTLNLKTKEISEQHLQGQHTTTFAEMFDLSFDARIIDTPGIRGFGMVDMKPEEISHYFKEFFALQNNCKFNNCLHKEEPHCAIKNALDENKISFTRYKSYLQMLEGDDDNYRFDDYESKKE